MLPSKSTLILITIFAFTSSLYGQSPSGSSARSIPTEVEMEDTRALQVIAKAEDHFKKGKLKFDEGSREQARAEFDKAIDVVLESGFDVRANQRLQTYYLELVERIYRVEIPTQASSTKSDSRRFLWIKAREGDTIGTIAERVGVPAEEIASLNGVPADAEIVSGRELMIPRYSISGPRVGFREQQFKPSPLDELSKVNLKPSEQNSNPEAFVSPEVSRARLYSGCQLKLSQAPELRGLHLGMNVEAVRRRMIGARTLLATGQPTDQFGYGSMRFYFVPGSKSSGFEGVEELNLELLDGRVTSIEVKYNYETTWRSVDEFVARVSEPLKLPNKWPSDPYNSDPLIRYGSRSYTRTLFCDGFTIKAEVMVGAKLRLFDQSTSGTIERRRAANEEKKRRTFKP